MSLLNALTAASAASVALALSDGTPVDFVKVTSKDNIQVLLPPSHPFAVGQDNGRIFRRDGSHYKGDTELTLVATAASAPAADTSAPASSAAAPAASNDNVTYTVDGSDFDNLDDAKQEAIDIFVEDPSRTVEIYATVRKVVGSVGLNLAA